VASNVLQYNESLIEERDQGIAEIHRQIGEVNEMFQVGSLPPRAPGRGCTQRIPPAPGCRHSPHQGACLPSSALRCVRAWSAARRRRPTPPRPAARGSRSSCARHWTPPAPPRP
jgi:hypothetical protein